MLAETFIYALLEPETGEVRYIGKANNVLKRYKWHLRNIDKSHRVHWIRSLKARGLKPAVTIIQAVPVEDWQAWEMYWIGLYREAGHKLVNGTHGGDGRLGDSPSEETRKKLSVAAKRRKHTEEELQKMSAAMKGKSRSPEHRQKHSLAMKGKKRKPLSEETRRKIGAANKGRQPSETAIRKAAEWHRTHPMTDYQKHTLAEARKKLKRGPGGQFLRGDVAVTNDKQNA